MFLVFMCVFLFVLKEMWCLGVFRYLLCFDSIVRSINQMQFRVMRCDCNAMLINSCNSLSSGLSRVVWYILYMFVGHLRSFNKQSPMDRYATNQSNDVHMNMNERPNERANWPFMKRIKFGLVTIRCDLSNESNDYKKIMAIEQTTMYHLILGVSNGGGERNKNSNSNSSGHPSSKRFRLCKQLLFYTSCVYATQYRLSFVSPRVHTIHAQCALHTNGSCY